jgi:lipopolysaccharide export system permease protein
MGILARHLNKEFFKLLALCLILFVSIYLITDFLQKIDNFTEAHVPKGSMLAYFFYKIPYITVQMVPVAALISVIVMFALMKKRNEIIALKACGMSIFMLLRHAVVASMGLAVAVFLFSELVVPYASSRSQAIWNQEVNKLEQDRDYGRDNIWYRGGKSIYWIRHFDAARMIMEDPVFYFFDNSFRLIKRIQGRRAVWVEDKWRVEKGVIQKALKGGAYDFVTFEEMHLRLPENPKAFLRPVKRPEEMSYWQLKRYAERVRLEGYDATRYLVDMNIKLAFPLINLVMVLIGFPIALGKRRGGIPLAVSLGVGGCFFYLVNLGLARSLGLSGVLPAYLSAWLANLIFLLFGIYLVMRLET